MSNVYPTFAIPVTWSEQNTYDAFKIVLYNGGAYTSKRSVPSGVQITNTDYWLPTGNVYKLMNDNITTLQTEITNINNTLDGLKKSVTLTTTTNTNGSFNINMNPTNKIIITMLPVRNDANYYQNQFYVTYSTNASFSGYVGNCKDVNLNNLVSQDVKIIVYYYDFS